MLSNICDELPDEATMNESEVCGAQVYNPLTRYTEVLENLKCIDLSHFLFYIGSCENILSTPLSISHGPHSDSLILRQS